MIDSIDQSLQELGQQLESGNSETLNTFLRFSSRFHRYSIGNLFLIYGQRPDASHVAGFQAWKDLGRFVRKGEKGIGILAPVVKRKKAESEAASTAGEKDDTTSDDANAKAVVGFRAVHVFDVSQTEGDALPEFAEPTGDPGEYLVRLQQQVREQGIELLENWIPGGAPGMSEGGRITIQPDLSPAKKTATLVHELAHEKIHRNERRSETNKLIRETEAEAVAFAVCKRIGIEPNTASSDYIRLYGGSTETLQQSLTVIRQCTAEILDGLLASLPLTTQIASTKKT